jgi:CheY-like chemotaxis protein
MTSGVPLMSVVDDDLSMREAISWVLRSNGWRTETFASAAAFLEAGTDPKPDCIVLDVRMPGMSGLELQRKLAEMAGTPPVIVVSAHAQRRRDRVLTQTVYGGNPAASRPSGAGAVAPCHACASIHPERHYTKE